MVLVKNNILKPFKITRVVVISGILSFLYLIELCVGLRILYCTFILWTDYSPYSSKESTSISWPLFVASLFITVSSTFTVNLISVLWEQKELNENGNPKSAARFIFHFLTGGIIWRYVLLCVSGRKDILRRSSLLLSMIKFLFTQSFTIPMIIVHISTVENLDEIVFDVFMVICISVTLLLTCTVFSLCGKEVEDVKKWECETINLVPLIFSSNTTEPGTKSSNDEDSVKTVSASTSVLKVKSRCENFQDAIVKVLFLIQTFCFSFGRLLALGILLKLAGIYSISIMFLQLLISVIYLKFQAPIIVSDNLPKLRQLIRLGFMSFILIFEWHLNRDPETGYFFSSNMKHSLVYYCITITESMFYIITWSITESYSTERKFGVSSTLKMKFVRNIILIGTLTLVLSMTLHILLFFWNSRKIPVFVDSIRRRYMIRKFRMSKPVRKSNEEQRIRSSLSDKNRAASIEENDDISPCPSDDSCKLEKQSSYRDLREPLDDEIEIYVRNVDEGRNRTFFLGSCTTDSSAEGVLDETVHTLHKNDIQGENFESLENDSCKQHNSFKTRYTRTSEVVENIPACGISNSNETFEHSIVSNSSQAGKDNAVKLKMASISETVTQQWGKFSLFSQKMTNTIRDRLQKRKEQSAVNSKDSGSSNSSDSSKKSKIQETAKFYDKNEVKTESEKETDKNITNVDNIPSQCEKEESSFERQQVESSEGFFLGDQRCIEQIQENAIPLSSKDENDSGDLSNNEQNSKVFPKENKETLSNSRQFSMGPDHKEGDASCSCFKCTSVSDRVFLRRRSLSNLSTDRKLGLDSDSVDKQKITAVSTPPRCKTTRKDDSSKDLDQKSLGSAKAAKYKPCLPSLKNIGADKSVEHFV